MNFHDKTFSSTLITRTPCRKYTCLLTAPSVSVPAHPNHHQACYPSHMSQFPNSGSLNRGHSTLMYRSPAYRCGGSSSTTGHCSQKTREETETKKQNTHTTKLNCYIYNFNAIHQISDAIFTGLEKEQRTSYGT